MAAAKISEEPKDIRLEVRLTERVNEMLEHCSEISGQSKGEIIRLGIEKMYTSINKEKELNDAALPREERILQAQEDRSDMEAETAYDEAYAEAYAEEYSKLIIDPEYNHDSANDVAECYAKEIAECAADEARKEFWNSIR